MRLENKKSLAIKPKGDFWKDQPFKKLWDV